MISKATRFATHASQREHYYVDLGIQAIRLRLEPGERRRIRYRLDSAPMKVAQQFLAALARDWDGPLAALQERLK